MPEQQNQPQQPQPQQPQPEQPQQPQQPQQPRPQPEWSPVQMLRQTAAEEWIMVNAVRSGRIGIVRRLETGPFREAWFRAVTWSATPSERRLVGYSHEIAVVAAALWEHQPPTAQDKPFPGYPASTPQPRAPQQQDRQP